MKLWDKNIRTEKDMLKFTTGKDPIFDRQLAPYDILGSMAHVIMLSDIGLLKKTEAQTLIAELNTLYTGAVEKGLKLDEGVEDIHSQVEMMLTEKLGDLGKKIHTGRSRNDQVLVDLKLYMREELSRLAGMVENLVTILLERSEAYKDVLMPGYTHFQVAMPSSFGLWFGAYAEALTDDLTFLSGVYRTINQNPLGSAAGYGSSFPINRELTTRLLGFDQMHVNVINAQLNRGKAEWMVASGMASVASTIARLAMDSVLYMNQNFGFITLPDALTTGSSIMPHKKNPDVLELVRARCNRLIQLPSSISAVTTNLPSGYHRDFQILKEIIFPAFEEVGEILSMVGHVMQSISVNREILDDPKYHYLFTVEEVNRKVMEGMPFRDAYKEVGKEIEKGSYRADMNIKHTHTGSIGNPGTEVIQAKLDDVMTGFKAINIEQLAGKLATFFEAQ